MDGGAGQIAEERSGTYSIWGTVEAERHPVGVAYDRIRGFFYRGFVVFWMHLGLSSRGVRTAKFSLTTSGGQREREREYIHIYIYKYKIYGARGGREIGGRNRDVYRVGNIYMYICIYIYIYRERDRETEKRREKMTRRTGRIKRQGPAAREALRV